MNDTRTKIIICIFLMVATFCIYSQVQDHEFINFDDDVYVTESSLVQAGLTNENIIRAFTTTQHHGGWIPITSISYMLDYQLYGLNPKGFLLTNLFFHIANSLLLFLILFRMTGAIWQSAFVAVVFALHPLNVDSVAWVAERKNVLSTFFLLLTIWAYIRYAEKPTTKRYSLVFLLFAFGLMSKPNVVTLPFVLLLLDYWPLERFKSGRREREFKIAQKDKYFNGEKNILKLVLEKFPLLILSALCSIMTLILFEKAQGAESVAQDPVSILTILTNVMISYFEYLWKMLWPKGLAILYAHPGNTLAVWKGVLCGIALLAITIISIKLIRKAPYFVVGWFWYLGTLIPVIGFITLGPHLIADRYAYLPLIGIFVIIAWGVPELLKEWRYRKNVLKASAGILILTLMPITWIQVSHWKSSITVFKHAIRVTDKKYPGFSGAHNNLGIALFAKQKNEEAISHYKMAIKINPDYAKAHYNLGNALVPEGKIEEAISHYKMAIKINPDYAKAYTNLGAALVAEGKIEEAISHYKMAIKIKPDLAQAHNNLGIALSAEGKIEEAISHYKMAIKLKPDFAEAYNNLGNALLDEQKTEEAISHYKMAIKIKPDFADAYNNLGAALLREGRNSEVISHYKMAIKLKPDYAMAYSNLGNALVKKGEMKEAISHYKMAIELNPDFADAHYNLGIALVAEGKNEEAISHYKMAIKINPDLAEAYSNLGNALRIEGKNSEAISHYKMAIKVKPGYAKAHYNLGIALSAEGENEEAISHYKMAIKLNPDFADAYNNLGAALRREGRNSEAISHYKMAIKLKPDYAKAYSNLGNALVKKGEMKEAISHYKMAIELKPDYAAAHNNLGAALVAEGKNEEAISHYKMAIKLNPGFAAAKKNLETALLRSEELE